MRIEAAEGSGCGKRGQRKPYRRQGRRAWDIVGYFGQHPWAQEMEGWTEDGSSYRRKRRERRLTSINALGLGMPPYLML